MGFRAYLIVWDWTGRCELVRHELHKVKVQSVCFSSCEQYIISLGGKDCGMLIVWNIGKNIAVCGGIAARETTGEATTICGLHRRSKFFITGGNRMFICFTKFPLISYSHFDFFPLNIRKSSFVEA